MKKHLNPAQESKKKNNELIHGTSKHHQVGLPAKMWSSMKASDEQKYMVYIKNPSPYIMERDSRIKD